MTVGQYDIVIRRGSTFTLSLTIEDDGDPINLTGYTAKFQIKYTKSLDGTAALSLTSSAGITLGGVAGTVIVIATDEQTTTLAAGHAFYDLVLISGGGAATAYMEGRVVVEEGVSA